MFDDHCCQITSGGTYVSPTARSRGLVLKLDPSARVATLVAQYPHSDNFDAEYMGNTQPLLGGNVFVGWGSQPYFSEYTRTGQLLLDAVLPDPDISYRATVEPWVGLPLYPPRGAARRVAGRTTVYASWNGATRVAAWKVLTTGPGGGLVTVATGTKSGFETALSVSGTYTTFRVQALDASGKPIGTSQPFSVRTA
jgi:hypothetical protein